MSRRLNLIAHISFCNKCSPRNK